MILRLLRKHLRPLRAKAFFYELLSAPAEALSRVRAGVAAGRGAALYFGEYDERWNGSGVAAG